jgi:hypothetical protein
MKTHGDSGVIALLFLRRRIVGRMNQKVFSKKDDDPKRWKEQPFSLLKVPYIAWTFYKK